MTKKEKILFSYIANIIYDERPSDVFIETSQDISKLLKRIEKLNIETLSIAPSIENITSESFDLFIVLDDVKVTEANIGTIKNLISQKIVIFSDFENDGKTDKTMIKLGLQTELRDKTNELKCFSCILETCINR